MLVSGETYPPARPRGLMDNASALPTGPTTTITSRHQRLICNTRSEPSPTGHPARSRRQRRHNGQDLGRDTPICHRATKRAAMLGTRSAHPIAASGQPPTAATGRIHDRSRPMPRRQIPLAQRGPSIHDDRIRVIARSGATKQSRRNRHALIPVVASRERGRRIVNSVNSPTPAVDRDRAAVLLRDDVVADRQAEAGAFAGRLGGEERLKQLVPDLGRDAGAVVAHPDFDRLAQVAGRHLEGRAKVGSRRRRVRAWWRRRSRCRTGSGTRGSSPAAPARSVRWRRSKSRSRVMLKLWSWARAP